MIQKIIKKLMSIPNQFIKRKWWLRKSKYTLLKSIKLCIDSTLYLLNLEEIYTILRIRKYNIATCKLRERERFGVTLVKLHSVTLNNVTQSNNLLLNSYFENLIIGLHVLYVLNIYVNQILFTIGSINVYFMHYFKL